jgi:hypothetical protein
MHMLTRDIRHNNDHQTRVLRSAAVVAMAVLSLGGWDTDASSLLPFPPLAEARGADPALVFPCPLVVAFVAIVMAVMVCILFFIAFGFAT